MPNPNPQVKILPAIELLPACIDIQMHRVKDVRRILRCCHNTVMAHVRKGNLKSVKVGKLRLITDASLRKLLADGGE